MGPRALVIAVIVVVVGGVAACADASPRVGPSTGRTPAAVADAGTFVTVTHGPPNEIQVRSYRDAHVGKVLLTSAARESAHATGASDGSLLVTITSTSGECRTRIERLDPATGHTSLVRTITDIASRIALSPDGHRLAYVTYPSCSQPQTSPSCPTACAGPAMFLPYVLSVLDLSTGRTVRSPTDSPGHPIFGVSWSPDGRRLAIGNLGDPAGIRIVDPTAPHIATAPSIPPPAGCLYSAPAWTRTGIIAARTCSTTNPDGPSNAPGQDPDQIVELTPTGAVTNHWPVPRCINGIWTAADPQHASALVEMNIGYGTGQCADKWSTRLDLINAAHRSTLLDIPHAFGESPDWTLTSD